MLSKYSQHLELIDGAFCPFKPQIVFRSEPAQEYTFKVFDVGNALDFKIEGAMPHFKNWIGDNAPHLRRAKNRGASSAMKIALCTRKIVFIAFLTSTFP